MDLLDNAFSSLLLLDCWRRTACIARIMDMGKVFLGCFVGFSSNSIMIMTASSKVKGRNKR